MSTLEFFRESVIPSLLEGTLVTIRMSVSSIILGYILGIILAVGRAYGNKIVRAVCNTYTFFFRGIPLLVQLLIIFYGLPSMGIYYSPYVSAVIGFTLCSGAYHSEYIRGAIQSIKSGQMMAAEALGMSRVHAIISIILPQALRRAIPGCSNEIISLIKYSSLSFMVTAIDLTGAAKIIGARYFRYTEIFLTVGIIYLVLTSSVDWALRIVEQKLKIPEM